MNEDEPGIFSVYYKGWSQLLSDDAHGEQAATYT